MSLSRKSNPKPHGTRNYLIFLFSFKSAENSSALAACTVLLTFFFPISPSGLVWRFSSSSLCLSLSPTGTFLLLTVVCSCAFLVFSAQVCRALDAVEEGKTLRRGISPCVLPCRASLSWDKYDRKSARWHRAGLQQVTLLSGGAGCTAQCEEMERGGERSST